MSLRSVIAAGILATTTPLVAPAGPSDQNQSKKLKLTALPSEGLLIQAGDTGVLIDAFVDPHETEGDSMLAAARHNMVVGKPPFSNVRLALISHSHHEHFHPPTAVEFMKNNHGAILASTPEIIRAVQTEYDSDRPIDKQLVEFSIDKLEITSETIAGIKVDIIPFRHAASMIYPEQVTGHIVHLGGKKILYSGDSEMQSDNWKPYNLKSLEIDIVVIPDWLYSNEESRKIIDKYVAPKKIVLVQVPPAGHTRPTDEQKPDYRDNVYTLNMVMGAIEF